MSLNVRPRFLVLFRISFDALIFIFSTIIINAFFNYDLNNKFLFLILWLFVSYISGKYSDNYNKFDNLRVFDAISYPILIFSFLIAFFNFQEFKLYLLVIFICNLLFLFYFLSKKQGKLKLKKHVLVCSKVIFDDIHSIIKKTYNDKSQILELYNSNNKVYLEQFDVLVFDEKLHFSEDVISFVNKFKKSGKSVKNLDQWFQSEFEIMPPEYSNILLSKRFDSGIYRFFKRFADLIISFLLISLTLPLIIFVSFLIFLEDRGPIIYKQKRSGKNRSVFNIYKLRTMKVDSEMNGVRWATKNDMRITFLGNYLRRCRIDELPQLINVIKGEMSLIGPRPERPEIDFELEKFIPEYNSRYQVSPGISGWAQVNYNYGASVEDSYNKVCYDNFYVQNKSFVLDLLIFFKTLKIVFNAVGSKPIR